MEEICANDSNKHYLNKSRKKKIIKHLFDKKNAQLWSILSTCGFFQYTGAGVISDIPSPLIPKSILTGISQLSDPESPVRIINFKLDNTGGPIASIDNGFVMNTYNNLSGYKISYKVVSDNGIPLKSNIKIGFYTSDVFQFNVTNQVFLICGSKGPSLFTTNKCNSYKGSFFCNLINFIYVAVDADCNVIIKVKAIVPKKVIQPKITYDKPIISYFNTARNNSHDDCRCNKAGKYCLNNIPVAITKFACELPDAISLILIKKPLPGFRKISTIINKYMDEKSLSITLFDSPNIPINPLETSLFGVRTEQSFTFKWDSAFIKGVNRNTDIVYMDTFQNAESPVAYQLFGGFVGIDLNTLFIPLVPHNSFYIIHYKSSLKIFSEPEDVPKDFIIIESQVASLDKADDSYGAINPFTNYNTNFQKDGVTSRYSSLEEQPEGPEGDFIIFGSIPALLFRMIVTVFPSKGILVSVTDIVTEFTIREVIV